MSRPRKPTALLEMSGAFAKNPQRRAERANEPDGIGKLGNPPSWMSAEEKRIWKKYKAKAPWLTESDELAYIAVVRLTVKVWTGEPTASDWSAYRSFLASLGLTSIDRTKVQAPAQVKNETEDEWSFLQPTSNQIRAKGKGREDSGLSTGEACSDTLLN